MRCQDDSLFFDDAGEPIGTVDFDYPREADEVGTAAEDAAKIRQETLAQLLDMLCLSAECAEQVGRRVCIMAFLSQCESRPRTLAELGRLLGVSAPRAHQLVHNFKTARGLNGKPSRKP